MPRQRNISGNICDSHLASLKRPKSARTIEAENQRFFDRMDRRYARICAWANNRDREEVTDHFALLLLLKLEEKRDAPIREKGRDALIRANQRKRLEQWVARSTGGRNAGEKRKAKAEESHAMWVAKARAYLEQGEAPHNVSSKVASYYKKSPKQVRNVLQNCGVLKKREMK